MTMEENRKYQIDKYLDDAEAEFDRILAKGERKRRIVRWSALAGIAAFITSVSLPVDSIGDSALSLTMNSAILDAQRSSP